MKTSKTSSMNCCRQVAIKFNVEENEGIKEDAINGSDHVSRKKCIEVFHS